MQDSSAHDVVVVGPAYGLGINLPPKALGSLNRIIMVLTVGWDRIDGWSNLGGSIERFGHEPWSQKDFGLRKNTSRQVHGKVSLAEPTSL